MKQLGKYLVAFLIGAGFALGTIKVTNHNVVIAQRAGSHGSWTLDAFEDINQELPGIIGDQSLSVAVIPTSSGYEITGTDLSVFGFFRRPWDRPLRMIDARMVKLRNETR